MDSRSCDALTRSLATAKTRRGLLGSLAALGAGLLGGRAAGAQQVTQVNCGNQFCASNPTGCNPGCVCCLYTNPITGTVTNSRCRPPGTCAPGTQVGGATTTVMPTTTTAAPTTTTTTTTTMSPLQGTCAAGADVCAQGTSAATRCNGGETCFCYSRFEGGTVCGLASGCNIECTSDAQCQAVTGAGSVCIRENAFNCNCGAVGGNCVPPCPS